MLSLFLVNELAWQQAVYVVRQGMPGLLQSMHAEHARVI